MRIPIDICIQIMFKNTVGTMHLYGECQCDSTV